MSWKTELNLKRIYNVFKRSKNNIYTEDINALKEVVNTIKDSEKEYMNDNLLFAKLLCVVLRYETQYFGNISLALKHTNSLLGITLKDHIELLRSNINEVELIAFFKSIGIDYNSANSQEEILKQKQSEIVSKIEKQYSYDNVEKSLVNSVNDFLKDVDNYK